ncbi:MAG TPA: AmmeMemoRadiSam system radical SAM enzyme [Atribacteraceae bacterium]|nr:AmmeMemoRadiSam system radical SAM enzyme [Atribacteraceae bacterium]
MKKTIVILIMAAVVVSGVVWFFPLGQDSPSDKTTPELALRDQSPGTMTANVALADGSQPARYWQELTDNRVRCWLCPQVCVIPEGGRGICRVRENREGALYTLVYGKPVAIGIGPIEKAPFHHFHPGHLRQTIATVGCNLRCKHCQNWSISQREFEEVRYHPRSPSEIIAGVKRAGLNSVSFTYTEPTVFFEYMYDIAKLARAEGIKTTLVTNGFISPEPLRALLEHMDAVRVDLKGFTEEFYREISGASLSPVLETLKVIQKEGVWLEIINLVIPTLNDCPEEIRAMSEWIVENLGPDVPLHINRFHPAFRMTHLPPTPVETLEMARAIAREVGINYVTIGNLPGHRYDSTYCPACDGILIHRIGMSVLSNNIEEGKCRFCGKEIPGVWE